MKSSSMWIVAALIAAFVVLVGMNRQSGGYEYGVYSTDVEQLRYRWETDNLDFDEKQPQPLWRRMGVLAHQPEPSLTQDVDVISYLTTQGWELVDMENTGVGIIIVFRRPR